MNSNILVETRQKNHRPCVFTAGPLSILVGVTALRFICLIKEKVIDKKNLKTKKFIAHKKLSDTPTGVI